MLHHHLPSMGWTFHMKESSYSTMLHHEHQRRALLAVLSHLMRFKNLLHVEGHDSISKQVHVNLTEANMH